MARYDNRHSRIVAWLKFVLPLASLALLSSMFLLARDRDPTPTIPFADIDVNDLAREERVGAPNYAGMTQDGAALSVTAVAARPVLGSGGTRISANDVTAVIERDATSGTRLVAKIGLIDTEAQTLNLTGGVEISTTEGLRVVTSSLRSRLDRTEVETGGAIEGSLRDSTLTAGRMRLSEGANGLQVLFTGGVKLIYVPSAD